MVAEERSNVESAGLVTRCATHPEVETALRCGRCAKPICPRCLIQTPVGARCRACARPQRLPTFEVGTGHLLRAVGVGLVAAVVGALIVFTTPLGGFFQLALLAGLGYGVGEAVSWAANRKRGRALIAVTVACLIVGLVVAPVLLRALAGGPVPSPLAVALGLLLSPFTLLGVALSTFVAANRVR